MSNHNNSIITAIIGIAGLVGIGYGITCHNKMTKVSERLNVTIDNLANDMEIDIPEAILNKAIDKAVAVEVKKAANEVVAEVRRDIHREVSAAVEKEYESIKDSVLREITASASKIDANKVRKDVEEAAKKAALEKFDANLEGILEKFNSDLDNAAKVYSVIKSMSTPSHNTNREFVVKIG